jgi:hypothetical protein
MTPPGPEDHVLGLLAGKWIAQAVSTAASLGISDALAEAPLALTPLARRLACDPESLARLMAVLIGEGLYVLDEEGRYQVTPAGRTLAGEGGLKALAAFVGSPSQWAPWSALPEVVRSGASAYERTHGRDLYSWLAEHPEDARLYDEGVDRFTRGIAQQLARRPELSDTARVVDVGGGLGSLLVALLERWPRLRGTLVELPHVLERAAARLPAGLADRVTLHPGSFFDPLPSGADLYVLKHVLHNWRDADAIRILARCREAVTEDGGLWIVEGVLPPGDGRSLQRLMDLEMMVLFGRGRARAKGELRELLRAGGFRMERTTHPLGPFARLVVARPAAGSRGT